MNENVQLTEIDTIEFNSHVKEYERGDYSSALKYFRPLAISGDAKAQFYLGLMYANGKGVIKSVNQAREWIKRASDQGYGLATSELSNLKDSSSLVTWKIKKNYTNSYHPNLTPSIIEQNNNAPFIEKIKFTRKPIDWKEESAILYEKETVDETCNKTKNNEKKVVWITCKNSLNSTFSNLLKLAKKKDYIAQFHLGMMYLYSDNIERDDKEGASWLKNSAENLYVPAIVNLANLYFLGVGVEKSEKVGITLLLKAANKGNNDAQYTIAEHFLNPKSELYNIDEGIKWLNVAAEQGHSPSLTKLADLSLVGLGRVAKDYERAIRLYKQAIDNSYLEAYYKLACFYLKENRKEEQKTILELLKKSAELNFALSQFKLGQLYEKGKLVPHSIDNAMQYYLHASENGCVQAQVLIANMYERGLVNDPNGVLNAYKWFRKAAENGSDEAQYKLGYYIENNLIDLDELDQIVNSHSKEVVWTKTKQINNSEKHSQEAFYWYFKGAQQGNLDCEFAIAHMYEMGIGVKQNSSESFKWYNLAAEHGNPVAQVNLARTYETGVGVVTDEKKALYWYKKAAEKLEPQALFYLGNLYEFGKSVRQDYKLALTYYVKAADLGNIDAVYKLGQLYYSSYLVAHNLTKSISFFERAAKEGHIEAQKSLVQIYLGSGDELEPDYPKAISILKNLVNQKEPSAFYYLGRIYELGDGVKSDLYRAVELYRHGAELLDANSMNALGLLYENGKCVVKSLKDATFWYQKAAKLEHVDSMMHLANIYCNGIGLNKNIELAIELFTKASVKGCQKAYLELGKIYEEGIGVEKDFSKALGYYRHLANEGNAESQNRIAFLYLKLDSSQFAIKNAFSWFSRSASLCNSTGCVELAKMYVGGIGCDVNYQKAIYYFKQAAEAGEPEAYYQLGLMYENGKGVKSSLVDAFDYYEKAAKYKIVNAINKVGKMLLDGRGCVQNISRCVMMFTLAAEMGDPSSQYELAKLYKLGKGVAKDNQQAYIWSSLSIACGNPNFEAQKFRDEISQTLSNDQLKEAQCETSLFFENYKLRKSTPDQFI